jgi:hypothetical protein
LRIFFSPDDIDVIKEDDPRTRPILVGQETLIEIDRGQSGLGLSVVGGSDTQLVKIKIFFLFFEDIKNFFFLWF